MKGKLKFVNAIENRQLMNKVKATPPQGEYSAKSLKSNFPEL